jgi:Cu(I)/Ag(I) efflux system membrane fusion protein
VKSIVKLIVVVAVLATALASGYWWGSRKDENGGVKVESTGARSADSAKKAERRILYYRNPMGLPDTSPTPKKDQMGMDYIPVYEGEEPETTGSVVKINPDKVQKLGVRTEIVGLRELTRTVQAVATIQANERQLHTVSPRFEGWIQKLYVNTTGQLVRRGEPLLDVYSPDLVTAQQEYLIAWKGVQSVHGASPEVDASMRTLVDSALQRLRNWDISEAELRRLQQEGKARQSLTLRAQASGVVLEKRAVAGMRFMPGEMLYQIADLSSVWVLADVFEQELGLVRLGQSVKIRVDAYPDQVFTGKVTFIYPVVMPETRTARVRIELPNPAGLLKPAMYARVEIASDRGRGKMLAVPDSAVLDTGARQLVLVQRGEGAFEPRPLRLGMRSDGYIEVLEGIDVGETVVVSANFLIDAESNLKAALGAFGSTVKKPAASSPQNAAVASAQTHKGLGTVIAVDPQTGSITVEHGPIASLNWSAMSMDFRVRDKALLKGVKPGQSVEIEIVQEGPGQFVITRMASAAAQPVQRVPAATDHKGH